MSQKIQKNLSAILVGIFVIGFIALDSFFIVKQTEQALVLMFGEPKRQITEAGLEFKIPFIENVETYDKRLLSLELGGEGMLTSDRKSIIIDSHVRYRIIDALKFRQSVGGSIEMMEDRLKNITNSNLKNKVRSVPLNTLLSPERATVMQDIRDEVNLIVSGGAKDAEGTAPSGGFGVEVVDMRVRRVDLPPENSERVFRRMQTERQRESKEIRAKGEEEAQKIRSSADKERIVILAEAEKESSKLRGQGDAEATKTFAGAFGKDPEFFEFFRTLQAYRHSLATNTNYILSPDSEILGVMRDGK